MSPAPKPGSETRKVYLAGPDVFVPAPFELGARKRAICARYGLEGVFPLESGGLDPALPKREQGLVIFDRLEAMMRGCDAAIVNMTPYHGPSMDVGSAFEMGFMRALGRPIFGYSNAGAFLFDRVRGFWQGEAAQQGSGEWRDPDGMQIEDFDMVDNLMIDGCVRRSTGVLVAADTEPGQIYGSLAAFELCAAMAAEWLAVQRRQDGF